MIDWLTLKISLRYLSPNVKEFLKPAINRVLCLTDDGEIKWQKNVLDIASLRSDNVGLFWCLQGGPDDEYLVIGGSPAANEYETNVFGSSDIKHCAKVLILKASAALGSPLPYLDKWLCRRIDVTENYFFDDQAELKQALRYLSTVEGGRIKGASGTGDTAVFNKTSDLRSGKAYHKGPQLRYLQKKGKIYIEDEFFELADHLLRLELKLGSRWLRRLNKNWYELTREDLFNQHNDFFGRFFGKIEVTDMTNLLSELEKVAPTQGQARAAYNTWALIKTMGLDEVKASIPKRTYYRHLDLLRKAGLSDTDFCLSNIVPLKRKTILLTEPVTSWHEVKKAAGWI